MSISTSNLHSAATWQCEQNVLSVSSIDVIVAVRAGRARGRCKRALLGASIRLLPAYQELGALSLPWLRLNIDGSARNYHNLVHYRRSCQVSFG